MRKWKGCFCHSSVRVSSANKWLTRSSIAPQSSTSAWATQRSWESASFSTAHFSSMPRTNSTWWEKSVKGSQNSLLSLTKKTSIRLHCHRLKTTYKSSLATSNLTQIAYLTLFSHLSSTMCATLHIWIWSKNLASGTKWPSSLALNSNTP